MKNSNEYSQKIKKFYRSLKRKYAKSASTEHEEPTESLVYAVISENMSEKQAHSAMKRFTNHFVDLNDLRVSLTEEIAEQLGIDMPTGRETALRLKTALEWIFKKYNTISLASLKKNGKRPAKEALEKIESISHFAVNYCMLTSFHGHAIPLTDKMVEYLRSNELVHPDADEQEIEGFLTRQIAAKDAYEFYYLLRTQGELKRTRKQKITKTKKKTKKKVTTKKRRK